MPKPAQIRGMLLEEVLLYLLRTSGYKTIEDIAPNDDTLCHSPAGIAVRGRGANHQIDAIAEFTIATPFTYPQRLLIEAKCLTTTPVGIEIVRNALGVLRDVQEYWIPNARNVPAKSRYHYQYAVFSVGHYTDDAQRFAFAQDIYLIPLARTNYFRPVTEVIMGFQSRNIEPVMQADGFLHNFRMGVRNVLRNPEEIGPIVDELNLSGLNRELLGAIVQQCQNVGTGILGILNRRLPVFMVSSQNNNIDDLIRQREVGVRISYDRSGWYINSAQTGQQLFSFDMPEEIVGLYFELGAFPPLRALDLKEEFLGEIQLIVMKDNKPSFITMRLDMEWLNRVRDRFRRRQERQ